MIKIKVIIQDIETCQQCEFVKLLQDTLTTKKLNTTNLLPNTKKTFWLKSSRLWCTLLHKVGYKTVIRKDCPLLSRHDLLAKAKELYHQEKLERESNENS
jgi:hypothetical protein